MAGEGLGKQIHFMIYPPNLTTNRSLYLGCSKNPFAVYVQDNTELGSVHAQIVFDSFRRVSS